MTGFWVRVMSLGGEEISGVNAVVNGNALRVVEKRRVRFGLIS